MKKPETKQHRISVPKEEIGVRLDVFLATRFPDYTRSYFNKLI
ncbi:RNA pseudouridine synthase, partial [candidate division KSB1 bacterium]